MNAQVINDTMVQENAMVAGINPNEVAEQAANDTLFVMVWVRIGTKENGKGDYIRFVKPYNKARLIANFCNAVGLRAGFEHQRKGIALSTEKQVKMLYALMHEKGWTLQA